MNYVCKPSLQHMAIVKIAITLWNQTDIRALITTSFESFPPVPARKDRWREVEDKVAGKVSHLVLPDRFKKKIFAFIKPIGIQILQWIEFHHNCDLGIDLPSELVWTSQGTIDKKKTAEILIEDKSLNATTRYKLACIYCIEDGIQKLWNEIVESEKEDLYYKDDPRHVEKHKQWDILWANYMKRGGDNMIDRTYQCSHYEDGFKYAIICGNRVATEYFWKKLSAKEKEEYLGVSAWYAVKGCHHLSITSYVNPRQYFTDVLCFLLSQMTEKQQKEVFISNPFEVLKSLLDWPWQSFFIKTANHMWDVLDKFHYIILLGLIIDAEDYNQTLFGEFWQHSPQAYKRYYIDESAGSLLSDLIQIKDKKNISLVLGVLTLEEKKKILFCNEGKATCKILIQNSEWSLLEFFIEECISSKDMMVKFKEQFSLEEHSHPNEEECVWKKFFRLLDDLIHKHDKKITVEDENATTKSETT